MTIEGLKSEEARKFFHGCEMAGWLHNFAKLNSYFFKERSGYRRWFEAGSPHCPAAELNSLKTVVSNFRLELANGSLSASLSDLIRHHILDYPRNNPLVHLMRAAHDEASGEEKRSVQREQADAAGDAAPEREPDGVKLPVPPFRALTPMGSLVELAANEGQFDAVQVEIGKKLHGWLEKMEEYKSQSAREELKGMQLAPADGQMPQCDARVYDVSFMTGVFLKSNSAEYLLSGQIPDASQLRHRIYRLVVDSDEVTRMAVRFADMKVRREVIRWLLAEFAAGVEKSLPFLSLVYQDEDSVALVGPSAEAVRQEFEKVAQEWWSSDGERAELKPVLQVSVPFRLGKDTGYAHQLSLLLADKQGKALGVEKLKTTMLGAFEGGGRVEPCSACLIRPIASWRKGHRYCKVCGRRREGRLKNWLAKPEETIWVEEVGDKNGRIAVVSASIAVLDWMQSGGGLESSAFMERPANGKPPRNVAASAARCRRLIETMREFWEECEKQVLGDTLERQSRRSFWFQSIVDAEANKVRLHQSYEIKRPNGNSGLPVVAAGREEGSGRLRLVSIWGQGTDGEFEAGDDWKLETENSGSIEGRISFDDPAEAQEYVPYLKVRQDPGSYEFVVPALMARACVESITAIYEQRFERVRNRMPLKLSVVSGNSAQPLRAFLDAARRAQGRHLRQRSDVVSRSIRQKSTSPGSKFEQVLVTEQGAVLRLPLDFDGCPADAYFPYLQGGDGKATAWTHAADLREEDPVTWQESNVEFEYLDSASRRFELAYSDEGDRIHDGAVWEDRSHRPLELEAFASLRQLGRLLKDCYHKRQIKRLESLMAEKAMVWQCRPRELPQSWVESVIGQLDSKRPLYREEQTQLLKAAREGLLLDAIEYEFGIEKNSSKEEED